MSVCPACAKEVDPLRAGHVAIFDERFYYFCDRACRQRISPDQSLSSLSDRAFARAPAQHEPVHGDRHRRAPGEHPGANGALPLPSAPRLERAEDAPPSSGSAPASLRALVREARKAEAPRELANALAWASVACGVLAMSLVLAGSSALVMVLRIAFAWVGCFALVARALRLPREPTDLHPVLLLGPASAACAAAAWAWLGGDPATGEAATFAGIVVAAAALAIQLVERARQSISGERMRIAEGLLVAPHGVATAAGVTTDDDDAPSSAAQRSWKPGEEVALQADEVLPVDGIVVAGEAMILPWLAAADLVKRREGDSLLSGARVVSGKLRVRAAFTGLDRAWVRLTLDPRRRADVHSRIARVARLVAGRGGLVGLFLGTLAGIANGESPIHVAFTAMAAWAAITTAAVASMAAVHVGRGVVEGLRRGIAYRSPADWDRASDVSIAAFCARGTLLLGEPELADVEAVGKTTEEQVLALAAGAESLSTHPVAMAIQRAAIARRIRADAVRSPSIRAGLGVSAVASTGEALKVGSRALMLKEKISVAIAEQKIAEIEGRGREVLLVALAGRLVGVLGLQDGLRPGARAAVQHLLDAQVEPVLVSGDSRETCEAIGRALDIEHIRPEVPLADRAGEVGRLSQGSLTVAVLGHPRTDEAALSAAHVAIAMPAGGASGEWGVMLASDDVRDGALAISLARRTKLQARTGLIVAVGPGIIFGLAVAFGLLPAAYAPLSALLGAAAAALHARATGATSALPRRTTSGATFVAPADANGYDKVHY